MNPIKPLFSIDKRWDIASINMHYIPNYHIKKKKPKQGAIIQFKSKQQFQHTKISSEEEEKKKSLQIIPHRENKNWGTDFS